MTETTTTTTKRVLICGTGLVESILAAALSCAGVQVVHTDPATVYGGSYQTFSPDFNTSPGQHHLHPDAKWEWSGSATEEHKSQLRLNSHRFMLDRRPQLIFADGEFLQLLLRSKCYRYLDLSLVQSIMHGHSVAAAAAASLANEEDSGCYEWRLVRVPLSKEDVFMDRSIPLAEKRRFMRFISSMRPTTSSTITESATSTMIESTTTNEEGNAEQQQTKPPPQEQESLTTAAITLQDSLDRAELTTDGMLRDLITFSIAHQSSTEPLDWADASRRIEQFVRSIGRYGKSPFLLSHYGTAELCQAFCRLSAVFGGIYMLHHSIATINSVEDGMLSVQLKPCASKPTEEPPICEIVDLIIASKRYLPGTTEMSGHSDDSRRTGRAILITTAGSLSSTTATPCLTALAPQKDFPFTIFWLRLGSDTCHAPEGFCVNYFWCTVNNSAQCNVHDLLMPRIEKLFPAGNDSPGAGQLLVSTSYWDDSEQRISMIFGGDDDYGEYVQDEGQIDSTGSLAVDVDWAVGKAHALFNQTMKRLVGDSTNVGFLPAKTFTVGDDLAGSDDGHY